MSNGELLDLSTKRESAPSKRWRNLFRVVNAVVMFNNRPHWRDGEHWGFATFPSREVAEQRAADFIERRNCDTNGNPVNPHDHITWLGAFPCEGESPP